MTEGAGDNSHIKRLSDCKIIKTYSSDYKTKCKGEGYTPGLFHNLLWQAHHILPCSALKSDHISARRTDNLIYIENCLCLTVWDINNKLNLIGLDTKWCYFLSSLSSLTNKLPRIFERFAKEKIPLPDNLPSHLIGHRKYCEETWQYMEACVWDTLKDRREIHKLDEKSIVQELDDAVKYFKRVVKDRGIREGGTRVCWKQRFKQKRWYIPFALDEDPCARHPGVTDDAWEHFLNLFEKIK